MPLAAYYLNPQRVPRDNLRNLERGKPVTLIDETGPPRWSHWPIGEEVPSESPTRDGTFSFSTTHCRLLELMPAMPAAGYRFRAEIRHDERGESGDVGLYFAYSKHRSGDDDEHTFCSLTFDDWAIKPVAPDGTAGALQLACGRCKSISNQPDKTIPLVNHHFRTVGQVRRAGGDWHKLAVEVRPEQVEVFWEGQSVRVVTVAQMDLAFRQLNSMLAKRPAPLQARPALHPEFLPRQGLGLFLERGTASFRRVVVEPL